MIERKKGNWANAKKHDDKSLMNYDIIYWFFLFDNFKSHEVFHHTSICDKRFCVYPCWRFFCVWCVTTLHVLYQRMGKVFQKGWSSVLEMSAEMVVYHLNETWFQRNFWHENFNEMSHNMTVSCVTNLPWTQVQITRLVEMDKVKCLSPKCWWFSMGNSLMMLIN